MKNRSVICELMKEYTTATFQLGKIEKSRQQKGIIEEGKSLTTVKMKHN